MDIIELIKKDIKNNYINKNATFNKNLQVNKLTLENYMEKFDKLKN